MRKIHLDSKLQSLFQHCNSYILIKRINKSQKKEIYVKV